ncbi:uncharacterized protein G2W53_008020 [Senna tora]|uniref:Uncharacterized protein n=1 Tax=Senna tora TaxID=362788 RepID=A0A834X7T9_9FABA|nr:uncharacterized protein G2W53_008020 [Senna tora]
MIRDNVQRLTMTRNYSESMEDERVAWGNETEQGSSKGMGANLSPKPKQRSFMF